MTDKPTNDKNDGLFPEVDLSVSNRNRSREKSQRTADIAVRLVIFSIVAIILTILLAPYLF